LLLEVTSANNTETASSLTILNSSVTVNPGAATVLASNNVVLFKLNVFSSAF